MIGFDRSEDVPQIAELPLYADPHTMAKYWGFPTLYPWQERIVAEASKPKAFVSGSFPNSAGKCQPCEMVIPTPSGPRRFGDLKVGDLVWSQHGKPVRVTAVFEKGKLPTYAMTFWNGEDLQTRATADHLWFYLPHSRRFSKECTTLGKYKVLTTEAIIADQGNRSTSQHRGAMPICLPVCYETPVRLTMDPYLVGAIIGNGCLVGQTPMFSSADEETLGRVRKALVEDYTLVHSSNYDYRITRPNNKGKENKVTTQLRELGLMGKYSHEKFIPPEYLVASFTDRMELLRGLMDTDGYASESGYVEYSTTSERLCRDMIELLRSLGGRVSWRTKSTHYRDKDGIAVPCRMAYRITVRFKHTFNPFHVSRKALRYAQSFGKVRSDRLLYEVEPYGEEECRCISVASIDGSYLCNDYLVTHNTSIILPLLGLTVMSAFPGSTVYTTAGSEAQLKDQLFKTLASRVRPFEKVGWKVNASDLSVTAPRVRGLPPSKWISRVPRNALTAEGYHSSVERDQYGKWHYCPLFCAIDEAKSVEDEVFEMMYRLIPDWMLVISTPDLDTGPFYRAVDPEGMKPDSPGVEIV